MTKAEIRARLVLAKNLFEQAEKIIAEINCEKDNSLVPHFAGRLKDSSPQEVYGLFEEYGLMCNLEEGKDFAYPEIEINARNPEYIDIHVLLQNGNYLTAFTGMADYDTVQAGMIYSNAEKAPLHDLALVEIPRDELAELEGLPANNDNPIIRVYENPKVPDFTQKKFFDISQL